MIRRTLAVAFLAITFAATSALASWYDDYDEGLAAVRKGNWSAVIAKMSSAIKGNSKEGNKVKTYGVIMINYHPYYYRGVAYLNTGRYEEAIADLEQTSGPGPENLGSIDTLIERAKKQLAAANEPEPEPARQEPARTEPTRPAVPAPVPAQPATPQIDPNLRNRANAAVAEAKQKIQAAANRKATSSPQYAQAVSTLTTAVSRNGTARTNDDLNDIITLASSAGDLADLAQAPNASAPAPVIATTTPAPSPLVPKPAAATTTIMEEADYSADVRRALEFYFAGDFEEATARFQVLAQKMPTNGWIHAFLGASLYSQYAFEAEQQYKDEALKSFRRAKQLRSWKGGLPPKYFSKRIRKAFDTEG